MMAAIPIRSEAADATGVAFLLSEPRSVHVPQNHRAYLRRMLVSDSLSELTPDWAYFVRCVVNVNELRPTAGREAFYEDAKLEKFRDEIGQIVRAWLEETGRRDPDFIADAQRVLGAFRTQPILKGFEPLTVPALLSQSDRVAYGRQLRASREVALPLFVDVLDAVSPPESESLPLLVFNVRNELVRAMCGKLGQKRDLAIQLLYLQALMLAHQPLSTSELELLQKATLQLLMQGLGPARRD